MIPVTSGWTPYCGAAPGPVELLARWNADPVLLAALAAAAFWAARLPADRRRFGIGAIALATLLFVSPFCALTSALFSARAVHHVALVAGLAPLIALTLRTRTLLPIVPATLAAAAIFWMWHAPAVYGWALSSDPAYWLMQLSLTASAAIFWQAVFRAPPLAGVGALLATMVQMGLLGALITFAPGPLYAPHAFGPQLWGFSPLEDQQLAGLIMWAPAAALYLAAALLIAGSWLRGARQAM